VRWCERPPTPESPVLSVYLDVDQSNAANLNRQHEVALRTRLHALEHGLAEPERSAFRSDATRVERFVAGYTPRARTLICFADDSADLIWTAQLHTSLPTDVRWNPTPNVRPLVEALDDQERYGVVLVDKRHARVLTVNLGEIEEACEV